MKWGKSLNFLNQLVGDEEGFRRCNFWRRDRHLPRDQELVAARSLRDQSVPHLHPPSRKDLRLQNCGFFGYEVRTKALENIF
jgi:hypothetical protein